MTKWPEVVSVRSILLWMITIEARGTRMLEVRSTRPEWRPDFRLLEECSDDQITRVGS